MKKTLMILSAVALLAACSGKPAFDPATVADATAEQVTRVEPLSWWTGMKMPLQLLVQGENISDYDVTVEGGKGVSVEKVNKAHSPAHTGSYSPRTANRSNILTRSLNVEKVRQSAQALLQQT